MSKEIEDSLLAWATEALELRHGEAGDEEGRVSLPPFELGYPAAVDMLQRVRQRLDRVEELQSKSRQVKGRVMRLREQAEFEASLAYDNAVATGAKRYQEYAMADEKKADAHLASLTEKREAHRMKRLESIAAETLDVVTQCYWGLEKLREDLLQMVRLTTYLTAEEVQT